MKRKHLCWHCQQKVYSEAGLTWWVYRTKEEDAPPPLPVVQQRDEEFSATEDLEKEIKSLLGDSLFHRKEFYMDNKGDVDFYHKQWIVPHRNSPLVWIAVKSSRIFYRMKNGSWNRTHLEMRGWDGTMALAFYDTVEKDFHIIDGLKIRSTSLQDIPYLDRMSALNVWTQENARLFMSITASLVEVQTWSRWVEKVENKGFLLMGDIRKILRWQPYNRMRIVLSGKPEQIGSSPLEPEVEKKWTMLEHHISPTVASPPKLPLVLGTREGRWFPTFETMTHPTSSATLRAKLKMSANLSMLEHVLNCYVSRQKVHWNFKALAYIERELAEISRKEEEEQVDEAYERWFERCRLKPGTESAQRVIENAKRQRLYLIDAILGKDLENWKTETFPEVDAGSKEQTVRVKVRQCFAMYLPFRLRQYCMDISQSFLYFDLVLGERVGDFPDIKKYRVMVKVDHLVFYSIRIDVIQQVKDVSEQILDYLILKRELVSHTYSMNEVLYYGDDVVCRISADYRLQRVWGLSKNPVGVWLGQQIASKPNSPVELVPEVYRATVDSLLSVYSESVVKRIMGEDSLGYHSTQVYYNNLQDFLQYRFPFSELGGEEKI
jgi:hypothetical protein